MTTVTIQTAKRTLSQLLARAEAFGPEFFEPLPDDALAAWE